MSMPEDLDAPEALVTDDADLLPIEPPVLAVEEPLPAAVLSPAVATDEAPAAMQAHEEAPDSPDHALRGGKYPSLYDTKTTTVVAVLLGCAIIGAVQYLIERIFREAKDVHYALTRFVVSMVALLVGAYICDLVVSGPDTSLLADSEKASILDFVKATALMIFSYFFGVKSAGAAAPSAPSKTED